MSTTADERQAAAEHLRRLAIHKRDDLRDFADAIAAGDTDDSGYWMLVRGLAASHDRIERAAADGAGLDADEPAAKAVAAAFEAIHQLTKPDSADDALEAAVEYAEQDDDDGGNA